MRKELDTNFDRLVDTWVWCNGALRRPHGARPPPARPGRHLGRLQARPAGDRRTTTTTTTASAETWEMYREASSSRSSTTTTSRRQARSHRLAAVHSEYGRATRAHELRRRGSPAPPPAGERRPTHRRPRGDAAARRHGCAGTTRHRAAAADARDACTRSLPTHGATTEPRPRRAPTSPRKAGDTQATRQPQERSHEPRCIVSVAMLVSLACGCIEHSSKPDHRQRAQPAALERRRRGHRAANAATPAKPAARSASTTPPATASPTCARSS